jgi:ABC-2 type transport system permease protein
VPETLTAPPTTAGTTDPTPAREDARRPGSMLAAQVVHALRGFRRNPVMTVVALLFPLAFLLLLGLASRQASLDPATGGTLIQHTAPIATVFAAMMAVYVMLPFHLAQARERDVLKRLRGTPLPLRTYVAGQILAALVVATLGTALMLLVAIAAFGLSIPAAALPALVVTFLVGTGCGAALGVAVAALVRGAEAVVTVTIGSFLLVAFASGLFGIGADLPRLLDVVTWWLPLRHFSTAFAEVLAPTTGSVVIAWSHLAVLAVWGAAGAIAAIWGLRRPERVARTHAPGRTSAAGAAVTTPDDATASARTGRPRRQPVRGRPSSAATTWAIVLHANRAVLRQPSSAFFSIAFPVVFTTVVPYALGNPVIEDVPLPVLVTPAMAVFAIVVTAFVNVPENIAIARDRGVLKRLRGTPLPASSYLAGRLGSIAVVTTLAIVGVFVAGWAVHGVAVRADAVLPLVLALAVGTVAFAALGLAVVALVPDASAVPAVGLGVFLPLGFISDMLAFGMEMPGPLATLGWVFPLKHLTHAVDGAMTTGSVALGHLSFVALWAVAGAVVALRWFRWVPRERSER